MTRPEILAPAGDEACLAAAVRAGADAVHGRRRRGSLRVRSPEPKLSRIFALREDSRKQ